MLSFSDISLNGNFYNGLRGGPATAGGGPGGGPAVGLNLVLNFASSQVTGVITATLAEHYVDTIDSSNWWELGHVSNTPQAVINNGVIVALTDGSTWTVTGTSYLSALSLDATSSVAGPRGREGRHDGGRHPHRHHGRRQLHRRDRPHRGLRRAPRPGVARRARVRVAERRRVVPPVASTAATTRSWNSARLSSGIPSMAAPSPWLRVKRQ